MYIRKQIQRGQKTIVRLIEIRMRRRIIIMRRKRKIAKICESVHMPDTKQVFVKLFNIIRKTFS